MVTSMIRQTAGQPLQKSPAFLDRQAAARQVKCAFYSIPDTSLEVTTYLGITTSLEVTTSLGITTSLEVTTSMSLQGQNYATVQVHFYSSCSCTYTALASALSAAGPTEQPGRRV